MGGTRGAKLDNVSKPKMNVGRSGVVALGKYESGHPSRSDTSLIAFMSAGQER
jgi:hypothetical protein